ncbi:hypothetical protein CASFOL_041761 [Castilleja foliolosa]|uniref:Uncharacterized protein n=1 Tax=Castilleja foliolosa TaxID=1961234 RepID=A0ABD3B8U7_9LAMI
MERGVGRKEHRGAPATEAEVRDNDWSRFSGTPAAADLGQRRENQLGAAFVPHRRMFGGESDWSLWGFFPVAVDNRA